MDDLNLRKFIELNCEKKDLKFRLAKIEEELTELEEILLEQFQNLGMSKITIEKNTIYIKKRLFVSPKNGDRTAVIAALKDSGLENFIQENFNTNTLTAYVKEQFECGFRLSKSLSESLKIIEKFSLNVIKS